MNIYRRHQFLNTSVRYGDQSIVDLRTPSNLSTWSQHDESKFDLSALAISCIYRIKMQLILGSLKGTHANQSMSILHQTLGSVFQ
jgi:hypothetical protein